MTTTYIVRASGNGEEPTEYFRGSSLQDALDAAQFQLSVYHAARVIIDAYVK
jgi:hypothetical protein